MIQNKKSNWQILENIITYKMSFSPKLYQENTLPCSFADEKEEKLNQGHNFLLKSIRWRLKSPSKRQKNLRIKHWQTSAEEFWSEEKKDVSLITRRRCVLLFTNCCNGFVLRFSFTRSAKPNKQNPLLFRLII